MSGKTPLELADALDKQRSRPTPGTSVYVLDLIERAAAAIRELDRENASLASQGALAINQRDAAANELVQVRRTLGVAVDERNAARAELEEARADLAVIHDILVGEHVDRQEETDAQTVLRCIRSWEAESADLAAARAEVERVKDRLEEAHRRIANLKIGRDRHEQTEAGLVERARRVDSENSDLRARPHRSRRGANRGCRDQGKRG